MNRVSLATNFVVVAGPGTLFPDDKPASLSDIKDDPATTILFVEIGNSDIPWYEPRDLRIDNMSFQVNDPNTKLSCIGNRRKRGAFVATADFTVHWLPETTPPATIKAMLTIDGGEKVTLPYSPFASR